MKLLKFALFISSLMLISKAHASVPASCQMRMLTIATEAYSADWQSFGPMFKIASIRFENGEKGNAAVVLEDTSANAGETCNTRVELTYEEGFFGCPDYKFKKINTVCN